MMHQYTDRELLLALVEHSELEAAAWEHYYNSRGRGSAIERAAYGEAMRLKRQREDGVVKIKHLLAGARPIHCQ